jgi:hypothetical protein
VEAFSISATAGSLLIEAVYGVLALAGLRIIWSANRGWGRVWRLVVTAAGFATPVLAYYGSLHPFPTFPNNRGLIFACIAALLVLVWFVYLQIVHPERVRGAARQPDEHLAAPAMSDPTVDVPVVPGS